MRDSSLTLTRAWRRRPVAFAVTLGVAAGLALVGAATPTASADPAAPAAAADPAAAPAVAVDPTDRASVLRAYQKVWVPAAATPTGWTGSAATCTPGTNSAAGQAATLRAVNFARALVGRRPVTMDAALSATALQAALISQATGTLSHSPPPSSACWTQAGADASGHSNLYGVSATAVTAGTAIESYLDDPGSSNTFAGHRRWVLSSRLITIGSGTTTGANALDVMGGPTSPTPLGSKVAAWPAAGFFPASLEPDGRWSVSIPGADFAAATVTVRQGAKTLATVVTSRADRGYGDNSFVWSVDPRYDISQGDRTFTVTVAGYTVGGVARTTRYTTTLFDATVGLPGRNVIAFPYPAAKKVGVTFDPGATDSNGLTVYYFSTTPGVCTASQNPNRVTTVAPGTCTVGAFVPHDDRWPDAPTVYRSFAVTG